MTAPKLTGNKCQCTACGEYFNGVQPFDHHRVGDYGVSRRCLTVAELEARGWNRNAAGFWCERADPNTKPRAHGFPPRFASSARVRPHPATRAPELQPPTQSP